MSEISSGRPLFPLSVDIGANKKLRKFGAPVCEYPSELNSQHDKATSPMYFLNKFYMSFIYLIMVCYD